MGSQNARRGRDRFVSTSIEPLERRRLFAANLSLHEATIVGDTFSPGATVPLTLTIINTGDQNVIQSFFVQVRLVRTDAFGVVAGQYTDPAAINATTIPVDSGVPVGAFHEEAVSLQLPANLAPATYSIAAFVDSTNRIGENDNNNNVTNFSTSFLVVGADKLAVIDGTAGGERIDLSTVNTSEGPAVTISRNRGTPRILRASLVSGLNLRTLGGNDTVIVTGGVLKLTVDGGDGNDKMVAGIGDDFLIGGAGKDTLDGGVGNDRLNGNGGNDRLTGNLGDDRLYGYAGNDWIDGGIGNDRVYGDDGDDSLFGGDGADRLYGGAGKDRIEGGLSADRLEGGDGEDTLLGQGGNDKFFTKDNFIDQLLGAGGLDLAAADLIDLRTSVRLSDVLD